MKRSGFVITEAVILALIGLATAFYTGAVIEVETEGAVTSSISYDTNSTRCKPCKEYYPEIIMTDR